MLGKSLVAILLALGSSDTTQNEQFQGDRLAVICFQAGEQVSGSYKICYYKCLHGTVAITINRLSFCPLTIDR